MHILYFIRHGQYDDKDTRTDCTGKELLSKGKQQAEITGSWLAEKEPALTSIYCSDYVRARQTAGIIRSYFTNTPLHVLQDLRECENLYYKDYRTSPSSFLDNLMEQPEMFFPKKQDSSVAFVCHANLIRYFISRYFLLDRAQWQNLWLGNCSISTLKFHDKSNVELDLLAFEEHIPRHLWT